MSSLYEVVNIHKIFGLFSPGTMIFSFPLSNTNLQIWLSLSHPVSTSHPHLNHTPASSLSFHFLLGIKRTIYCSHATCTNITRGACQTQKVTFRWGFPSEDSEHGPDLYFLATPWEILVNQQVVEHSSVLIASDSLSSHPLTSPSAWLKMVSPAHHGPP